MDRFGEVGGGKVGRVGKVGDGAGDFERTIVGPGAETKFGYGYLQELLPFRVDLTELPDIADTYLGIGENYSAPESFALPFPRRLDPAFDRRRRPLPSPPSRRPRTGSLPFYHLTLKAQKPVSREKYPDRCRTWGDWIKCRRLDLKRATRTRFYSAVDSRKRPETYLWRTLEIRV